MRPMVTRREHGVTGDLARQRVGRMGNAGDETDATVGNVRLGCERATRFLLEHVEDGLQRCDGATADRFESFVDPSDRGAEGDAELADLSLVPELLELFPQRVVEDGLDP